MLANVKGEGMSRTLVAGCVFALCALTGLPSPAAAQFPTDEQFAASEAAQAHVATAMALAGTDLVEEAGSFCTATGPRRPALNRRAAGLPPEPNRVIEPTRVFDNLYYLGFNSQNGWAVTTSDGIILLDTLNNTEEARDVIVPGLRTLGLDPADIKYIILSHGHPGQTDHTGGAAYLQETYGAKVMMGGPDWDLTLPAQNPERPLAKRDMDVTTGQKLTLGDTTLTLALLPGHTPGSLGVLVPVMHEGQQYSAMFFGGTQMPTRESAAAFEQVFNEIAKPLKAAAAINAHAGILGDTVTWLEERRRNPDGPNPFFYGAERFDRYLSIMLECGKARVAALEDAAGR